MFFLGFFFYHVSAQDGLALHVLQAELADVQASEPGVLLGVRRVVPGVQLVSTEQNVFDHVIAFSDLSLHAQLLLNKSNTQEGGGGEHTRIRGHD